MPIWSNDPISYLKLHFIVGFKKNSLSLLHVVIQNSCNEPFNSQLDLFADDINSLEINNENLSSLLKCFVFSYGDIVANFGDDLMNYLENASKTDDFILPMFKSLVEAIKHLSHSMLSMIDLKFSYVAELILSRTINLINTIELNK